MEKRVKLKQELLKEDLSLAACELSHRMCGYSTGTVGDAIISYFKLPDCSKATRKRIFEYLAFIQTK